MIIIDERKAVKNVKIQRYVELCKKYKKNTKRVLTQNNSDAILNFVAAKDT